MAKPTKKILILLFVSINGFLIGLYMLGLGISMISISNISSLLEVKRMIKFLFLTIGGLLSVRIASYFIEVVFLEFQKRL